VEPKKAIREQSLPLPPITRPEGAKNQTML